MKMIPSTPTYSTPQCYQQQRPVPVMHVAPPPPGSRSRQRTVNSRYKLTSVLTKINWKCATLHFALGSIVFASVEWEWWFINQVVTFKLWWTSFGCTLCARNSLFWLWEGNIVIVSSVYFTRVGHLLPIGQSYDYWGCSHWLAGWPN